MQSQNINLTFATKYKGLVGEKFTKNFENDRKELVCKSDLYNKKSYRIKIKILNCFEASSTQFLLSYSFTKISQAIDLELIKLSQ